MLSDHIFRNISEALDYVLVEESSELMTSEIRKNMPMGLCFNNHTGAIRPISMDSLDNSLSGFYNTASPDKFIMTRLVSGRYCFKPNLRKRVYLFRGQANYYEPCTSGMFRDMTKNYYIAESVLYQEMILLILSHPLAQLWDLGVELLGTHYGFEANLFGLTQHYYNKTLFLDLTSDPDVAAFFATTRYDWKTDTYQPIKDETGEGVLCCYALNPLESFKPDSPQTKRGQNLSTIGLQIFPRSEKQRGFLVCVPRNANFNTYPEVKVVKFKHDAKVSQYYFEKFHGGDDLFPKDILMSHWKRENKDKRIVSEQTLRLNAKFNPQKTYEELRQELLAEGFAIQHYQPSFTGEELDEYYQKAKELWQEFCDKIHIPGDKDGNLKDAMRRVPEDARYSWAFDKTQPHTINYKDGYLLREYEDCLKGN